MATTMATSNETIALFGATGRTGKHVLRLALEQGYTVRALVRTPSKLPHELLQQHHEHLTIVEGDVTTDTAKQTVQETCTGANYVIICLSGPNSTTEYPAGFMTQFVRNILWPVLERTHPKVVLFQASAFCAVKGYLPLSLKLLRNTVGRMVGILPGVADNEGVIAFLEQHPLPKHPDDGSSSTVVIVTRPGRVEEKEAAAASTTVTLEASQTPETNPVTFRDVAAFTLRAMKDESLAGQYPFLKIKKTS